MSDQPHSNDPLSPPSTNPSRDRGEQNASLNPRQGAVKPEPAAPSDIETPGPKSGENPKSSPLGKAASAGAAAAGVSAPFEAAKTVKKTLDQRKATRTENRPGTDNPSQQPSTGQRAATAGRNAYNAGQTARKVGKAAKATSVGTGGATAAGTGAAAAGTGAAAAAAGGAAAGGAAAAATTAAATSATTAATGAIAASAPAWLPFAIGAAIVVAVALLVVALIASTLSFSSMNETTLSGLSETNSASSVIADGINPDDADKYVRIGDTAGVPWQFIPAIKYVHENKENLSQSPTTLGDGTTFMTWNVCQNACKEDWRERADGWVERIKQQQPDVLLLQEAGFSKGPEVGKVITAGTGLTVAGKAIEGQHIYFNKKTLTFMESGRIELQQPYGARWARFKKADDSQFIAVSTHVVNNKGTEWDDRREKEITEIYEQVVANNPDNLPIVFGGDFNSNKSRDRDAPYEFLKGKGYENALKMVLADPINNEYNSGWGGKARPVMKAAKDGNHVDSIFVSGGTTVNTWEQVPASRIEGGDYQWPFITDHNALVANLTLPPKAGGAAVAINENDDDVDADSSGIGKFKIDVDKTRKHKGFEKFDDAMAEDEMASAETLATILRQRVDKINPSIQSVTLTAGAEFDSGGQTSQLTEAKANRDNTDIAAELQQSYIAALSELPYAGAEENAPLVYQVARGWALGMQACTVNTSNGFVADGVWSAPLKAPLGANSFAMRVHPITGVYKLHEGADMGAPMGTPIVSAGSGTVIHSGGGGTRGGWAGIYVEIDHGNGIHTIYAHMSATAGLEVGQTVTAGVKVGEVGSTGYSTGAHLHFQVEKKGKPINPMEFLKERGITLGKDAPIKPGAGTATEVVNASDEKPSKDDEKTKKDDDSDGAGADAAPIPSATKIPTRFKGTTTDGVKITLNEYQVKNAASIVAVGQQMGIPENGLVIALMTALQESTLKMYANKTVPGSLGYPHDAVGQDHDSLGLFQQRPTAGWGSIAELMDAEYNAKAFFGGPNGPNKGSPAGLLDNRQWGDMPAGSWESLPLGVAAQRVQVSAFPDAYDKWEPVAKGLVAAVSGMNPNAGTNCGVADGNTIDAAGVVAPSEEAKIAIAAAREHVGKTWYSWGGGNADGPSKGIGKGAGTVGFDCSGLTLYAYAQAGITLPRLSYDQDRVGIKVTKDDLSPGDLVYWKDGWHVAIYVGDGKVIHAPRTGKQVEEVPLEQAHSGKPYGYSRPWAGSKKEA